MSTTITIPTLTEVEWEVDALCEACGKPLDVSVRTYGNGATPDLNVTPCKNCLDEARTEGREEAKTDE